MNDRIETEGEGARRPLPDRRQEAPALAELLRAAPGLARIAAAAGWRSAGWTMNTYTRAASRIVRAAASGESTAQLFQETNTELREYARSLLGLSDALPRAGSNSQRRFGRTGNDLSTEALRRRGEALLRQSADVTLEEDSHPAYTRILEVLVPDEGRILRLLAQRGPQPSVDVRTGLPFVSELVAPGRTMIGEEAGCRHSERVHAYLNNLFRLGLVWFSHEPIKERQRYQVLEAQPEIVKALRKGGRMARTVRRSILLTPFGQDFCSLCLPLETPDLQQ